MFSLGFICGFICGFISLALWITVELVKHNSID